MEKLENIIEVLDFCKVWSFPARVVGRWVWIQFDAKPDTDTRAKLKTAGFRWSPRRSQWSHACGHDSRPARNYRPWDKYKTVSLEDAIQAMAN